MIAPNKKGPRKLKSWPLLAAQNVYRVRLTTTTAVRITDSRITFPVLPNIFHYFSHVYTSPVRNSYAKWDGLTCPRKSLNAFDFSDSERLKFKQSILHTLFSMGPVVLDIFFFLANFLILNTLQLIFSINWLFVSFIKNISVHCTI